MGDLARRTPMKRSGFASQWQPKKREDGPQHIREILTLKVLPRLVRVPTPSAPIFNPQPKHEYVRDEGYRRFVASLPCFVCGRANRSQAAHSNAESDGKGGAIKASDLALFPLCADEPGAIGCHTRHDQAKDGLTRDQRRAREVVFIARMAAIPRP
jgi:hypothetical protein